MSTLILFSNLIEAFVWITGGIVVLLIRSELPGVGCSRSYKVSKRWLAASFIITGISAVVALGVGKFYDGRIEFMNIYSLLFFYLGMSALLLSFVTLHNSKNLTTRGLLWLFCPTVGLILIHPVVASIWGAERVYSLGEYLQRIDSSPALILRTAILLAVVGGTIGVVYKYFKAREAYLEMMNNYFSDDEHNRRSEWIDHYSVFLLFLLVLVVVASLVTSVYFDIFYGVVLTCGMIYLIVKFVNYRTAFHQLIPAIEYAEQAMSAPKESPDSAVGVLLQRWMAREDKPYLKCGLSLGNVSQMVGIGGRKLSAHINLKYGMTFNSWINMLRVQEVERILRNPQYNSKTLPEIAAYAGFADQTAMGGAFKKITGVSPAAFRKSANG